ncbi:MAG: hypothetical protein ACETWG_01200 [Candidatus Neomarinimicrobiota bacterium]
MGQIKLAAAFVMVILLLGAAACSFPTENNENDEDSAYFYFQVRVDSISAPGDFWVGDTLHIQLYGIIGLDGCNSFAHFEDQIRTTEAGDTYAYDLDLTVWGKRDCRALACPTVVVPLDHCYYFYPPGPGMLFLKIHQPDDSTLQAYVRIHDDNIIID